MCLASTSAVWLACRLIQKLGFRASVAAGILAVYTTAALSVLLAIPTKGTQKLGSQGRICGRLPTR